jgi:hypothetical protein
LQNILKGKDNLREGAVLLEVLLEAHIFSNPDAQLPNVEISLLKLCASEPLLTGPVNTCHLHCLPHSGCWTRCALFLVAPSGALLDGSDNVCCGFAA